MERYGGAIFGNNCLATIQNNIIKDNQARIGAGIYLCHGAIINNIITNNVADYQGGAFNSCDGAIINNTIYGNQVIQF